MAEAKFTKGPWHWVGANYIDGAQGETVLECGDDGKDWGLHSAVLRVSDADRALIAAAPAMYEALKTAEALLYAHGKPVDPAITAALKQALGE